MNSIEERLWNYIDGTCPPNEYAAIASLIENDYEVGEKYRDLLLLNANIALMELEEPPMAFTYNVMESIRAEHAQQPLKAAVNKRIILGIAAFFVITITALLVFALSTVNWSAGNGIKMPAQLNVSRVAGYFNTTIVKGFLFFDVVMGLFLLDHYVRRKNFSNNKSVL